MANRRSTLGARVELDKSPFQKALESIKSAVQAWKGNLESMKLSKGALTGEGLAVGKWTELSSKLNVAGMALNAVGSAAGLVGDKLKEAAEIEMNFEAALTGLRAASDGTETLAEQVSKLMVLGQKPGLGFQEAVKGSRDLQAIGLSAKESRVAIEEFGNAVAKNSGTKLQTEAVFGALKKIGGSASVTMDQVDIIADIIPEFLTLTRNLDKSDPKGWVRGAVEALKSLPRATLTAREALGNLDDAYAKKIIEKSDGRLVAVIREVASAAEAGMDLDWDKVFEKMSAAMSGAVDGQNLVARYEMTPREMEERRKAREKETEERKKQAELEREKAEYLKLQKQEEEKLAKLAAGQKTRLESERELKLLEAKKQGQAEIVEQLERTFELEDMIQDLEEAGMSPAEAKARAQAIADAKSKIAEAEATAEKKRQADVANADQAAKDKAKNEVAADAAGGLEVLRLRAAGKNKEADKLERSQEREARQKQLEAAGMDPNEASRISWQEKEFKEAIASGRRKTYGGDDRRGARGLGEISYAGLDDYKSMQGKNILEKQAAERKQKEREKTEAAAAAKAAKAIENWGPKMVEELAAVNQKLEAINSKPVDRL